MTCEHKFEIIEIYEDEITKRFFFSVSTGFRVYVLQCTECGALAKESISITSNTNQIYSKYSKSKNKSQFNLPLQ